MESGESLTPTRLTIEGAAQEAAGMAELVEAAKEGGAQPASPNPETAEEHALQQISQEVETTRRALENEG